MSETDPRLSWNRNILECYRSNRNSITHRYCARHLYLLHML